MSTPLITINYFFLFLVNIVPTVARRTPIAPKLRLLAPPVLGSFSVLLFACGFSPLFSSLSGFVDWFSWFSGLFSWFSGLFSGLFSSFSLTKTLSFFSAFFPLLSLTSKVTGYVPGFVTSNWSFKGIWLSLILIFLVKSPSSLSVALRLWRDLSHRLAQGWFVLFLFF